MRMRKHKHFEERLFACREQMIAEPQAFRGHWGDAFGRCAPLHIEIGCGKGRFITELAKTNPDINFLAIERISNVLLLAMERAGNLPNLRFISFDAQLLPEIMKQGECARIYLNFSDPWPRAKHAKRRLTHENFLKIYEYILIPDGEIFLKTDNRDLFEFSLNSFCSRSYRLKNISLDLHSSAYEGNIMTEYEERFSSEGYPIYRLEAQPPVTN